MADRVKRLSKTAIPYADYGWPLVTGCSPVRGPCDHCYAAKYAATRGKHLPQYAGLARKCDMHLDFLQGRNAYEWTGEVRFHPELLDAPLHTTKPGRVFTAPTGDLFHYCVSDWQLDDAFTTMAKAWWHDFIIVTKRPERMREYMLGCQRGADEVGGTLPWPNVWLTPAVWDQESADRVIPILLDTPAAVRGISLEPMLGAVQMRREWLEPSLVVHHPPSGRQTCTWASPLDWVILGGETGPGARPMQPEHALSVYRKCKETGTPFWFKDWGDAHVPNWYPGMSLPDIEACHDVISTHELPEVPS